MIRKTLDDGTFRYQRICINCDSVFWNKQNQGIYCSRKCKRLKKIKDDMKDSDGCICAICGYKRADLTKHINNNHYISIKDYKNRYPNSKIILDDITRSRMKAYIKYRNNPDNVWNKGLRKETSNKLREIGKKISEVKKGKIYAKRYIKICPNCGKEMLLMKNNLKKIYCSLKCFHTYIRSDKFKNSPKYEAISRKISNRNKNKKFGCISNAEIDIFSFLKSLKIVFTHNQGIRNIYGRPDFSFPELNKIIEYNGCYWHNHSCIPTDLEKRDKRVLTTCSNYRRKVENYKKNSFELLVIWECEWKANPNIIKQKIKRFLGV